jgi:type IX secretion system PorP/SprF family membrane protein
MNRLLLIIFIVLLPIPLAGQLYPLWDQYFNNILAINPAFAGSHEALSATTFYRNQWVGFKGAPKNQALSMHSPLFNEKVGVGLIAEAGSIGIYKITSITGNYSFRTDLRNGKLSLGLGFGASIYNISWSELEATDIDDILLLNNPASSVFPNFSLGTYYYTRKYFIGLSLPMFLTHEMDHNSGRYRIKNRFSQYNYLFTGGYLLDISPRADLLPSLLIKYHPEHPVQLDVNAQIILQDIIWLGIGYRNKSNLMGIFQFQANHQFRLGYTYCFDLGPIGRYTSGSHELMLNYVFRYNETLVGPRHFGLN